MKVMVSGGFDPIHLGHIELFEAAASHGDLVVVLNSDAWLQRKKGFSFQRWDSRARIISAMRFVSAVESVDDSDGTVIEALERLSPDYFANGGDRIDGNTPELETCRRLGITPLFGLGGGKEHSSSGIATRATVRRSWGLYDVVAETDWCKVKRLVVDPMSASSMQRHAERDEHWFYRGRSPQYIPRGEWHQLKNETTEPLEIIEVQLGRCREDDIERSPQ